MQFHLGHHSDNVEGETKLEFIVKDQDLPQNVMGSPLVLGSLAVVIIVVPSYNPVIEQF